MKDNVYLDNAATSWPKPDPVYRFMDRFSREVGVNAGRGSHALAADADQLLRQTRSLIAAFAGFAGPAERVVFASNGTDALNTAIDGLLEDGAHVVTTALEHNAVARVLNHAVRDRGVCVTAVACDDSGYVSADAVAQALRPDTALLIVNHASNVVGSAQDIDALSDVARAANVPLVLDAAQTMGVLPIDMDRRGISVLAFPGHKGLFGPMGCGGLVVAEHIELRARRFGGTGVDSASEFQPDALPWRLEPGTLNMPGIAGLHAAQLWFRALGEHLLSDGQAASFAGQAVLSVDDALEEAERVSLQEHAEHCRRAIAHVHAVEYAHLERIEALLARHPAVRVLGAGGSGQRVATLSMVHQHMDAQQMSDRLDADHGICCRAGLQCAPWAHRSFGTLDTGGSVRFSPGFFTDDEDLAQLAQAFDDVFADGG